MNPIRTTSLAIAGMLAISGAACAQYGDPTTTAFPSQTQDTSTIWPAQQTSEPAFPILSAAQLDQLLGPIALYPDPLIAQILPAATYPIDIVRASRFVRAGGSMDQIDLQDWDPSVRAVAHYPSVIQMMDDSIAWTQQLGQAFIAQPDDVMQSVQRLRIQAQNFGNLATNNQQQVVLDDSAIRIVPTNPDIIYVPTYQPSVVYYQSPPAYSSFVTYSYAYPSGIWLDLDCDWRHRWFYRPGWTWNRWHDHYSVDRGRFLNHHDHFDFRPGERPSTIWRRDDHRPLTFQGHRLNTPSQFDRSNGRGDRGRYDGDRRNDRPTQRPNEQDRPRVTLPQPQLSPFDHTQRGLQRSTPGGTTFTPQRQQQRQAVVPPQFTPRSNMPSAPTLAPRPQPAPTMRPAPAAAVTPVRPAPQAAAPRPAPRPAAPAPQQQQDNTRRGLQRGHS